MPMPRKPICSKGHPVNAENYRTTPQGWLRCRVCEREGNYRRSGRRPSGPKTHCNHGHELTLENTYLISPTNDTPYRRCRLCEKLKRQTVEWRESANKRARKWRSENRERANAIARAGRIKSVFGITWDDYAAMLSAQGGVCAICKNPCKSGRRLAIDHDHSTGKVRALLCGGCNTGLGGFRENPASLVAAAEYVWKHTQIPKLISA